MIITEYYKTRSDGVVLNRSYSDQGMMIQREGVRYSEAIDPAHLNRLYIETDIPIESETDSNGNAVIDPNEATVSDYQNALRSMGVDV